MLNLLLKNPQALQGLMGTAGRAFQQSPYARMIPGFGQLPQMMNRAGVGQGLAPSPLMSLLRRFGVK